VTLVLYDNAVSSNALKVRFLLAELGLEYERRHVSLAQPRPDWYLALNRFGRVPFLEDGELGFGESNAILRYLANRENRTDLYPADPAARARVDSALDAWSTQIRSGLFPAERVGLMQRELEEGGSNPEDADQDELAAAIDEARPKFDLMEAFVADNGTVLGTFTIADCAFAPALWRWYRLPLSLDAWPKVALLRETVTQRPAFEAAGPVA
jgi:glutathione S-transferase